MLEYDENSIAKSKGRLQKWVDKLIESFDIHPEDIKSCLMEQVVKMLLGKERFEKSSTVLNVKMLNA